MVFIYCVIGVLGMVPTGGSGCCSRMLKGERSVGYVKYKRRPREVRFLRRPPRCCFPRHLSFQLGKPTTSPSYKYEKYIFAYNVFNPPVETGGFLFCPQVKNFSFRVFRFWGKSVRQVNEGISPGKLIFQKVFSFEGFRCLPNEEENIFLIGVAFYPSLFTDI